MADELEREREELGEEEDLSYMLDEDSEVSEETETPESDAREEASAGQAWQDPVLTLFNYYRAQGYTDDQIIRGLAKLYEQQEATSESQDEETPEFLTPEEELEWKLQKRIEKLEQMLQKHLEAQQEQAVLAYNGQLIDSVLREYNIEELTPELQQNFVKTFRELFPTINTYKDRLTRRQVEVVLREILSTGAGTKSAAGTKQSSVPKHVPREGAVRGNVEQSKPRSRETDRSTRVRRWLEL